jgi:SAM-dependent methyltransferase
MNEARMRICASPEWAAFVESELLPWVLREAELGDEVLEVGPGPGLTTDVLRRQVPRLTAVEIDERLARSLAGRLAGTNVTVLHADATAPPLRDGQFSSATLFTMLHHVPSAALQDRCTTTVSGSPRPCPLEARPRPGYLRNAAMARYWHAAPAQTYTWKTS